jgi:methylase of polypeptide subunit release factors
MPLLASRQFADRFLAEQAAFARGIHRLPKERRSDYAAVLLHRLMFVRFLQRKGWLADERSFSWHGLLAASDDELPGAGIDVADAALDRLFAFFDEYEWRLEAVPSSAANILTPAVIGPLFEKHVNRKEQGAYYTKDDVTAYLASRTIIPAVLDAAAAPVERLLRADPDRYLPEAVQCKGQLPGESELEADARRDHCRALRRRLRAGTVRSVNELITCNLDLERFAADVIAAGDEELLRAVGSSLQSLTVLDPTCGSGAFLVAAFKVLEMLWKAWLRRMPPDKNLRQGFRRLILSRNLHGIDLMPEAVELCRMRLVLELAATEPDADLRAMARLVANIRQGNVLVDDAAPASRFDVVVGNPPYLPAERVRQFYSVSGYQTADCPDVYAWVLERSAALLRPGGRCGMIVPLSLGFSGAFAACRRLLFATYGENWFASFGRIPAALFAGDVRVRNTIHIGHKVSPTGRQHTTRLHRWFEAARPHLFQTLTYVPFDPECWRLRIPKLNVPVLARALEECLRRSPERLGDSLTRGPTPHVLYVKKTAYNWLTFCPRLPDCFNADGESVAPTQYDALYFADAEQRDLALLLLNGKWTYAFWCIVGDDFHVARWTFAEFPIALAKSPADVVARLRPLARELERALLQATAFKRNAGQRVGTYNLARCRHVTDRSDRIFAEVLGLTHVWDDVELLVAQVVKTEFEPR